MGLLLCFDRSEPDPAGSGAELRPLIVHASFWAYGKSPFSLASGQSEIFLHQIAQK
jgi:hypothetical protein